jgi:hypothetical protein
MSQIQREEIAQRGESLYEATIRAEVEPQHHGKYLALDVETGDYEIDSDEMAALDRAAAKRPHPLLYLLRIGYPAAHRIGGVLTAQRT